MSGTLVGKNLRVAVLQGLGGQSLAGDLGGELRDAATEAALLLELLSSRLNFNYTTISPSTPAIGIRLDNGSWTGILGLLVDKQADVAVARIPNLPLLNNTVKLSLPYGSESWVTLQQPPLETISATGLLIPFSDVVWILVALSVLGMAPVMYLFYRLQAYLMRDYCHYVRATWDNFVVFVVVSLLRQDHNLYMKIHTQRVLMATWWIVGLLLTTFYTANLTASLAKSNINIPIQTPSDLSLSNNRNQKWVIIEGGSLHAMIQDNSEVMFTDMRSQLAAGRGKLAKTAEEAAALVAKQGYIWFGPKATLLDVVVNTYNENRKRNPLASKSELCTFFITERPYYSVEFGLGFANDTDLKDDFNEELGLIDQFGITTFLRINSSAGSNPCIFASSFEVRPLTLEDFVGLFLITVFGFVLAAIAFSGENCSKMRKALARKVSPSGVAPAKLPTAELSAGLLSAPAPDSTELYKPYLTYETLRRKYRSAYVYQTTTTVVTVAVLRSRSMSDLLLDGRFAKNEGRRTSANFSTDEAVNQGFSWFKGFQQEVHKVQKRKQKPRLLMDDVSHFLESLFYSR